MTCSLIDFSDPDIPRIGLIADSHGNLPATRACIRRLQLENVELMMHLGDIFDSCGDEGLVDLLDTIQHNNIGSVKGNNDYQVEKALENGASMPVSAAQRKGILNFLRGLPTKKVLNDLCFAHSLPYDSIRAFYEPIDTGDTVRAAQVFKDTPYRIIFCGHSHHSIVFRWRPKGVTREAISPGEPLGINPHERYIIVVGSVENKECGVFDAVKNTYQRIRL